MIAELQGLAGLADIYWPEEEAFGKVSKVSSSSMSISVREKQDWFEISGKVKVDEELVMDIRDLLDKLNDRKGNFIQISDKHFIALEKHFIAQLEAMKLYNRAETGALKVHPLSALSMRETFADANADVDEQWASHLDKFEKATTISPRLPKAFEADLRSYQYDGFRWLCRLAEWGVGACLADDMGLGKTVQALALLLKRKSEGPALVIAPASVCYNWIHESMRFTPTLKCHVFGEGDLEREEQIQALGKGDLIVCSYGLLQRESELLTSRKWGTVVLDEAQAIKNFATKRTKAAMKLETGFRIATTGTPIENHLGELWTLFNFINPGLLGSLRHFNDRFAKPIERDKCPVAREQLKRLVSPFILRRLKVDVLDDLPPKTEIVLHVEHSAEEKAFYEALRRESVDQLETDLEDVGGGQQHLMILAALTRLRRACCHPKLVEPKIKIEGAKLKLFAEVVNELRDNGHRALVFSQFVDHLSIVRKYLDKQKISYQYLDGSTPKKKRQIAVDGFQDGEGDLFLISLKAGGTGLNLTAADYVIHLDPWWNPAVEDQASDRAHRIGQQRPVTIYRFVTKETIEEKIIALHAQKRELADNLLSGTESAGKLSAKDLLNLIKENV